MQPTCDVYPTGQRTITRQILVKICWRALSWVFLVIPQSLGYHAVGLPVYGLYSAIVPVLVYAYGLAQARSMPSVPVAITAIMTAQALQPITNYRRCIMPLWRRFGADNRGTIMAKRVSARLDYSVY